MSDDADDEQQRSRRRRARTTAEDDERRRCTERASDAGRRPRARSSAIGAVLERILHDAPLTRLGRMRSTATARRALARDPVGFENVGDRRRTFPIVPASSASATTSAIADPRDPPVEERLDRDLVGRAQPGRGACRRPARPRRRGRGTGTPPGRAARSRAAERRSSRCAPNGVVEPVRVRRGRSRSGRRMSGIESWAMVAPSVNSTIEWTTDCGCTTTSIWSYVDAEQLVGLDHLEALVHQRRRVDGDLRAHRPGRVRQRVVDRDRGRARPRVRPRNGPPLAVSTMRRDLVGVGRPRRHW